MSNTDSNLPSVDSKLSLLDWLEEHFHLPFRLPRIPLLQTARNLDKATASIVAAAGENAVARIRTSTTRIDAMSSAEKAFIERGESEIWSSSSSEISNRALQYALGDAIQKQGNREEILRIAGEQLASDGSATDAPSEIDEDWLNSFKSFAETKTNTDIQQLWGKILSTEIRNQDRHRFEPLIFFPLSQ